MGDDRITLRNPNTGRDGTRIRVEIYEPVRQAILDALAESPGVAFGELSGEVERRTDPGLWEQASVGWYTTSVKLDLEARGLLRRDGSPQRLYRTEVTADA